MSPDGKLIAIAGNVTPADAKPSKEKSHEELKRIVLVVDAADPQKAITSFRPDKYIVEDTLFAKNDRLLVWVEVDAWSRRVLSLALDGSTPVVLFENQRNEMKSVLDLGRIVDLLPDHPTDILMSAHNPGHGALTLYRVNVITGDAKEIEIGSHSTFNWSTQNGVPMVRFDVDSRGLVNVLARAPGEQSWKSVRKYRTDQLPEFFLVGATEKPAVFLVGARLDDEDLRYVRARTQPDHPRVRQADVFAHRS